MLNIDATSHSNGRDDKQKSTEKDNLKINIFIHEGYIHLHGKKLKGGFLLHRLPTDDDHKIHWLLIKKEDAYENPQYDIEKDDKSVVSHKTLKEIRKNTLKK